MPLRILIAEDEEISLRNVIETLADDGHEVAGVRSAQDALLRLDRDRFDLLVTDIKMPGMSGLELLEEVRRLHPGVEVVVVTGYGSISSAVEAMRKGALDYITKPFDLDDLSLRIARVEERRTLKRENIVLKTYFGANKKLTVIAEDPRMKDILATVESMKDSRFNVLMTGETGVGKSLVAKIIHLTSPRAARPFLAINCATLTEDLLASEIFGHERGAFTGALSAKQGLFEIADTGTLFLDEIAEMTPVLQAKLLKVLDEGEFYRVGGTKPLRVDIRFIAATNQNVAKLIAEGRFREDLYYRLNTMEIFIPPLRERRADIMPLAEFFLAKHLPKYNKKITGFSTEVAGIFMSHGFPGNIRELENIIERAILLEQSPLITAASLPHGITSLHVETFKPDKVMPIEEIVKNYAENVVRSLGGNKSRAAQLLGISRTSLWKILKKD
jgi:DNA-binding NtrC family response regulator